MSQSDKQREARVLFEGNSESSNEESSSDQIWMKDLPQDLSIYTSIFNIICKKLQLHSKYFLISSTVTHKNRRPLQVKPILQPSFLQLTKNSPKDIRISIARIDSQIQIQCKVMDYFQSSCQKILDYYFQLMGPVITAITNALSAIGQISLFSKNQIMRKRLQIQMKKSVVRIMLDREVSSVGRLRDGSEDGGRGAIVQLVEIGEIQNKMGNKVKGGYSIVESAFCLIKQNEYTVPRQQKLAIKRPRKKSHLQKIQNQIQIIKLISNPLYVCTYYLLKEEKNECLFMTYAQKSLRDFLSGIHDFGIEKIIDFSLQIILGLRNLHKAGIIHRDLKPENILIARKQGKQQIKIIDFGESTIHGKNTMDSWQGLGSTPPYSPCECYMNSSEGYTNFQVDLWSINIILYEMVFKSLPISFKKVFSVEIVSQWLTTPYFSAYQIYRKKRGIAYISEIIALVSSFGLQLRQKDRLKTEALYRIYKQIDSFYKNCMKLL